MKKSTYDLIHRCWMKLAAEGFPHHGDVDDVTPSAMDCENERPSSEVRSATGLPTQLVLLEDRVLYDAAPFDVDASADLAVTVDDAGSIDDSPTIDWAEVVSGTNGLDVNEASTLELLELTESLIDLSIDGLDQEWPELVVVDAGVENHESLIEDLGSSSRVEVLVLDSGKDGFQQVGKRLSELGTVSAIHVLSHASDGQLNLGNASLSLETLNQHAATLASWKPFLSDDADLLFYGCELAGDLEGQELLSRIVDLTDADVAASIDLTGHSTAGANWVLEFHSGVVGTEIIVSGVAQEAWTHTLAVDVEPTAKVAVSGLVSDQGTIGENRGSRDAIAADAEGNFVVVWSEQSLLTGWGVKGQRYDSNGNTVGGAFTVNQSVVGDQGWASVDMNAHGEFVVTWTDVAAGDVMGRYFDSDGVGGAEFVVGDGDDSSVAINDAGRYVIVYEGSGVADTSGIYASYYDSDHSLIRGDFLVNTSTTGSQLQTDVDINSSGEMIVVWNQSDDLYAQRLASDGTHDGSELALLAGHFQPVVEMRDDGTFFVVADYSPGADIGARAAIYNESDSLVAYFSVNQTTAGDQEDAAIVLADNNEFVITWTGNGDEAGQEDSQGVFMSRYLFDGNTLTALEEEVRVNTYTAGSQGNASVAATGVGTFLVAWDGENAGSSFGVYHAVVTPDNVAPSTADSDLYLTENHEHVFTLQEFQYQDFEGDPFSTILITDLPKEGQLLLNGTAVAVNDEISAADIASGMLTYRQVSEGYGGNFDQLHYRVFDGSDWSSGNATMDLHVESADVLWLNTASSVTGATDVDGPDSWDDGDILQFGGTELQFGNTEGSFSVAFSLDAFSAGWVDAQHVMSRNVTIGQSTSIDLYAGDLLFSTEQDQVLPGIAGIVEDRDIVVFRPDVVGDYSAGTFFLLFDYSSLAADTSIMPFADLDALTVVEKDTRVGDSVLVAGQILFGVSDDVVGVNATENDIFLLDLTAAGEGNSAGASGLFISGDDIHLDSAIDGLEFVERDYEPGGFELAAGTLLVSVNQNEQLGNNSLQVEDSDIVSLTINRTSQSGPADAEASLFFDGSDVDFHDGTERDISGFSLLLNEATNHAPSVTDSTFRIFETTGDGTIVGIVDANDPDYGDVLRYDLLGGDGFGVFAVDELTGEVSVVDSSLLDFDLKSVYTLHVSVTDGDGAIGTATITIELAQNDISGNLFNDVNANGNLADDGVSGFGGATVHLYADTVADGILGAGDTLVATTTTGVNGDYVFTGMDDGAFFVVVDSKSLTAHQGFNTGFDQSDLWAEQTWGSSGSLYQDGLGTHQLATDGFLFGGRSANGSDNHAMPETMEHATLVTVVQQQTSGVDFGFSFNVVTNLEGGDIAATDGQTAQGSLRQFIINANAIVGGNEMRFVPVVSENEASRDAWQLVVTEALPELIDADTTLDGQVFSVQGNSLIATASANLIGDATNVGTSAFVLSEIVQPEFEIVDGNAVEVGLLVTGDNVTVKSLRIEGFGGPGLATGNIVVAGGDQFELSDSHLLNSETVNLFVGLGADNGAIHSSMIEDANESGISLDGNSGGVDGWTMVESFVRNNGQLFLTGDGIQISGDVGITIEYSLLSGNSGSAVDITDYSGTGVRISENAVIGNGVGNREMSGIRLVGSGHQVLQNLIQHNQGAGVYVAANGLQTGVDSSFNLISANEFGNNGGIAIDLGESAETPAEFSNGDGVSDFLLPNANAGNNGIQSPTLTSSVFDSGTTEVQGTAGPNQRVEFYLAIPDPDSSDEDAGRAYGEGVQYLGWAMTDALGNFTFSTNSLGINDQIAAIAIDGSSNTSEFSRNIEVAVAPESGDTSVSVVSGDFYTFQLADFPFSDLDGDSLTGVLIQSTPGLGQLFNGGQPVAAGDHVAVADIVLGNLVYQAPNGVSGNPFESFTFRVDDGTLYSDLQTVTVQVTNDSPVFVTGNDVSVDEGESSFFVSATDPELDAITYSITGGDDAGAFVIDSNTGQVTFLTTPDYESPADSDGNRDYEITIRAQDVAGNATFRSITVHIEPVNDMAPVVAGSSYTSNENDTFVTAVTTTDDDIDSPPSTVSFSLLAGVDDSDQFQIDPLTGELSFLIAPDFEAPVDGNHDNQYEVWVRVEDADGLTSIRKLTIQVQDQNETPTGMSLAPAQVDENSVGGTVVGDVSVVDEDLGDSHTFHLDDDAGGRFVIDPLTGRVSVAPGAVLDAEAQASHTIDVVASDTGGNQWSRTLVVHVNDVNEAPVAKGETFDTLSLTALTITPSELLANDIDPELDNLHIKVINGPSSGTFAVLADGTWEFEPDDDTPFVETVDYVVTDGVHVSEVVTARIRQGVIALPVVPEIAPLDVEPSVVEQTVPAVVSMEPADSLNPVDSDIGDDDEVREPVENPGGTTGRADNSVFVDGGQVTGLAGSALVDEDDDIGSDHSVFNRALESSESLTGNYDFSYQKSSIDLSQLIVHAENESSSRALDQPGYMESSTLLGAMWESLDKVNEEMMEDIGSATGNIAAAASITGLATAFYVVWMARGGMLVASLVSSMPAWQSFDPLPVLRYSADDFESDGEDDSIGTLLDRE